MDSRQHPRDSKARHDAEAAEYATMERWDAEDAGRSPASDLDIFTTPELEQQADLYYATGIRLYAAAGATPGHDGHLLMAAALEQFELQGAALMQLARRFADRTARNA